jgi:hypothetical protein
MIVFALGSLKSSVCYPKRYPYAFVVVVRPTSIIT